MTESKGRILLVDDSGTNRQLLQAILSARDYQVELSDDGLTAWDTLQSRPDAFDLILLDRIMPGLDGLSLLKMIRSDHLLKHTPVILQTSMGEPEHFAEGFLAGANGYLAKPINIELLLGLVNTTLDVGREQRKLHELTETQLAILQLARRAVFHFRTMGEAEHLAIGLGQLCPCKEKAVIGLTEIFLNAIEHGNLGIDYMEKGKLLQAGSWQEEIARRLTLPPYRDRIAKVWFTQSASGLRLKVTDQGEGFNWRQYLDFDPARCFDLNGRGIATARTFYLDEVAYLGRGNAVRIFIKF